MHQSLTRRIAPLTLSIAAAIATVGLPNSAGAQGLVARPPASTPSTQAAAATQRDTADATTPVADDSPRASLTQFLEAARDGDFIRASRFLNVTDSGSASPAVLARQLALVLDHYVWFDLSEISPLASGDTTDGLPKSVDQVASLRVGGAREPVRMTRQPGIDAEGNSARWRFSPGTVQRIPHWYGTLGNRWLVDHLPARLLRSGPFDLLWWQWAAIVPLLVVAYLVGVVASRIIAAGLGLAARRTETDLDDQMLGRLAGPLIGACTLTASAALVPLLDLYAPSAAFVFRAIRVGYAAVIFWAAWRAIDVVRQLVSRTRWAAAAPSSRSLVPLGARVSKAVVAALGLVAILSMLGYPIASLVAGLGIGGLAVALAAQKTIENLFGAFSIGVDQPFREGDFVRVDDFVGTVEAIGLRSTRFRTLDRTLVSLPNGRLVDMRLESFTARDRLRLSTVVGLVYETTAPQMRAALAGFERVLRAHPKIWPDAVVVRFSELAASSLNIDVMAWFLTSDWGEFQRIRQEILLQFMEVVEDAGTSFAFPTTTVHLAGGEVPTLPSDRALAQPFSRG
jgi:MscS family membrane protein